MPVKLRYFLSGECSSFSPALTHLFVGFVVRSQHCIHTGLIPPALLPKPINDIAIKLRSHLSHVAVFRYNDLRFRPESSVRFRQIGKVDFLVIQISKLLRFQGFFGCCQLNEGRSQLNV